MLYNSENDWNRATDDNINIKHNIENKRVKLKNIKYHFSEFLKYKFDGIHFLVYANGIKVQRIAYKWIIPVYSEERWREGK